MNSHDEFPISDNQMEIFTIEELMPPAEPEPKPAPIPMSPEEKQRIEEYERIREQLRRHDPEKIAQALAEDPDLENRLSQVGEVPNGGSCRVMYFDPADVEAVGTRYVFEKYVRLFGATYNHNTGVVTGYIN